MDLYAKARQFFDDEYEYSGFEIVYPVWEKINGNSSSIDKESFLHKFAMDYFSRPSNRISKRSKTVADPLVLKLLTERISGLPSDYAKMIGIGHKLAMAAENIIGAILEEYIHSVLIEYGWSACWGQCIRAVDFCSRDGQLLQVKNKSNTENSSSNKIRANTEILKWYRFNANNGHTRWDELNQLIVPGQVLLSEEAFQAFALSLIKKNPQAINVIPEDEQFLKQFILE